MKILSYSRINADYNIFMKTFLKLFNNNNIIIIIYINDILIFESYIKVIQILKDSLNAEFIITNLDEYCHYLNMLIIKNRLEKSLYINQKIYI